MWSCNVQISLKYDPTMAESFRQQHCRACKRCLYNRIDLEYRPRQKKEEKELRVWKTGRIISTSRVIFVLQKLAYKYKNISSVIGLIYWQLKAEVENHIHWKWAIFCPRKWYDLFILLNFVRLRHLIIRRLVLDFARWSQVIGKQGSKKGSFVG